MESGTREREHDPLVVRITQGNLDNLQEYIESSDSFVNVFGYVLRSEQRLNPFEYQLKEFMRRTIETREKFSTVSIYLKNGLPVVIRRREFNGKQEVQVEGVGEDSFYYQLMDGLFFSTKHASQQQRVDIERALADNLEVELRLARDNQRLPIRG